MLGISRQAPGCTLLSNGVLLLDPVTFLESRGVDPEKLDAENCNRVVGEQLKAAAIWPLAHVILTDPDFN